MRYHYWYVQQLVHYTCQNTEKIAGEADAYMALEKLICANTPLYQKEVESISPTQLCFQKAVAQGETQLTSTAVMDKYKVGTPRDISKNKAILVPNDILTEDNGKYEFLDPAFELWFLKLYFRRVYLLKTNLH
ncbi:ATP-binding protein [Anditalea andensis]|uniref:Uncharacterized protein n=1 Tax=Anditalea andensis TaxID=1048983 RepID=A0A074KWG1_9BACT|nr:hypothetical protein [Anditalea andensis]KEO73269.1 hypothetical protein EL17_13040 [Anditalea andensis]